jgi:hypothetical protein
MYKRLISPKVYSRETDLTYKTPKTKKNPTGTGSSGGSGATPIVPPAGSFLLTEDSFYILTEDNFKIIL